MEINLLQQAKITHSIYTTEKEYAVEITAERHEQLNRWLSERLKTPLNAPDLNIMGYWLEGGYCPLPRIEWRRNICMKILMVSELPFTSGAGTGKPLNRLLTNNEMAMPCSTGVINISVML